MGDHVSLQQHIDVILEGLPQDYESIIESKFGPLSIEEVEALLLAYESLLQKCSKKFVLDSISLNLTQATIPNYASQNDQETSYAMTPMFKSKMQKLKSLLVFVVSPVLEGCGCGRIHLAFNVKYVLNIDIPLPSSITCLSKIINLQLKAIFS